MRGGFDSRRRRILAGALGMTLLPRLVFAQAQRDAVKNREIYLYKGADREKRILEGAKKEREVVVYTSLNLKDSVPIVEVFERKYDGVKVRQWRSSSEKVLQRAIAEARAGRFSCDILETNDPEMEAMHREQLLEEFFSPHFKDLPAAAFPRHRHHLQPQRRAAGGKRRADPLEGAQAHLRAPERDRGGAPRPAPLRGTALFRLHALPRRSDDPEGAQPRALEPRRGHAPQQVPLRDDRPGDHARRGRPLGETLVGSFPQRSEDPEGSRLSFPPSSDRGPVS